MNLLSITPFNVNPRGGATGKSAFLTAMILLGAAALALALFLGSQFVPGNVVAQAGEQSNSQDDPELINVRTLEQLNAIRWDMDGNGMVDEGVDEEDGKEYMRLFGVAEGVSACPEGTVCNGYELMADLDFDTHADGILDFRDAFHNAGSGWEPVGDFENKYNANFQGNGHIIANLHINRRTTKYRGLFGALDSNAVIEQVGLENANVSGQDLTGGLVGANVSGKIVGSYVTGTVSGRDGVGGLVGRSHGGEVKRSYASATVSGRDQVGGIVGYVPADPNRKVNLTAVYTTGAVSGTGDKVGGLVGDLSNDGTVTAAYATSTVTGAGKVGGLVGAAGGEVNAVYAYGMVSGSGEKVGGLVGDLSDDGTVTFAYASGPVTGAGDVGGLIGAAADGATITASYYDTNTSGRTGGTGPQSTTALQSPSYATGIYSAWNTDFWDFGTSTQYPALKVDFDGKDGASWQEFGNQKRTNLIPIENLDQLYAIRWDSDGNGRPGSHANQYRTAFGLSEDEESVSLCRHAFCSGYELVTNLDFDDAHSYAGGKVKDVWSDQDESGAGWEPIPEFFGEFHGNGHTISNLYINLNNDTTGKDHVGLFGMVGRDNGVPREGLITRLGLVDVNVISSGTRLRGHDTGGLVGTNFGDIQYSYVTGRVTRIDITSNTGVGGLFAQATTLGGLAGDSQGSIVGSYANVAVSDTGSTTSYVGGLVGQIVDDGTITASYATGKVSSVDGREIRVGGLVGEGFIGKITASYASGEVIGAGSNVRVGGLLGAGSRTSIESSYSTAVVTGNGSNVRTGGLVAQSTVEDPKRSYWDTDTSGIEKPSPESASSGKGNTTAELQTPIDYTGDFEEWDNIDLNGNGIVEPEDTNDFWHFGTASQYPALDVGDFNGDGTNDGWREFGHQVRERPDLTLVFEQGGTVAQLDWTSVRTDHWTTPPRTIEYALYRREGDSPWSPRGNPPTATEHPDRSLNPESKYSYQVRVLVNGFMARGSNIIKQSAAYVMDSDGDGLIEVSNLAQLNAIRYDPNGDGVPSPGGASSYRAAFNGITGNVFCSGPCRGYELDANLDFDTGTSDDRTDDAYYRSGSGWEPIDYGAVFEGNGYSISNLYIRPSTGARYVGLFGKLGSGGLINHVRLVDVDVAASGDASVGGLVGLNDRGTIVASHVIGQIAAIRAESVAGGLVGRNARGTIAGSYAASSVLGSADARGGLVGKNDGGTIIAAYATGSADGGGGLVGANAGGTIIGAYSTGAANGGLVGTNSLSVTHGISSYWDTSTSGAVSSAGGRGKITAELQGPTGYTGIYASWNVDIDDADKDGDPFTGGDNPWNFGSSEDYPTLNLSALGELSFVDRAALAEFYHATGGENWTRNDNWLSDKPMSTWVGVDTNVNGRVTSLNLRENNLVGEIPVSLGNLADLYLLDLADNSLSGVLPTHLGNLTNLRIMTLERNTAKGKPEGEAVPGSGLSGNIPPQLGRLSNFQVLDLSDNNFEGAVPEELGNLPSLAYLALDSNSELSGQLPSSFTNLSALQTLFFNDTGLCAPSSLRQLLSGLKNFTGPYCE